MTRWRRCCSAIEQEVGSTRYLVYLSTCTCSLIAYGGASSLMGSSPVGSFGSLTCNAGNCPLYYTAAGWNCEMFLRAFVLLSFLFSTNGFISFSPRFSKNFQACCRLMSSSSSSRSSSSKEKVGIIIIDHGSRVPNANNMLLEVNLTLLFITLPI